MGRSKIVLFALSGMFLFLAIILFIANINGYIIRLQGYFNFSLLLLSTFLYIFIAYIVLIKKAPIYMKIIISIYIFIVLGIMGPFIVFPNTEHYFVTNDDFEVIVQKEYFQGTTSNEFWFYKKDNILFSKKIGACSSSVNYLCSFEIVDNLFIIEDCGRRTCDIEEIELD